MMTKLRRTHTPVYVRHKPQPVLDVTNRILNITCATAAIETLQVKEQLKTQPIRPQLNVVLQSKPGALKTTILDQIGSAYNVTPYSYVTHAAMIGSIDRATGQVIPGVVWEARKKPLLLDEFRSGERGDAGAIDVLLGVLESGHYKRRIAVPCQTFENIDGLLYYRFRNGEIEVQTRFPTIIATMRNLDMSRSDKVRALLTRCIPIRYDLPDEVVDAALQGSQLYYPNKLNAPSNVVIKQRDYQIIIRVASEIRLTDRRFRENYTRAVGDLCRIFAVLGTHDLELYRLVCYLEAGYHIGEAIRLSKGEQEHTHEA